MKKLFLLLSFLFFLVTSAKSQVYKFHVSHLESYHYPSTMGFSESQEKHTFVQDGGFLANFDVTVNLNKNTITIKEANKSEVVFPIDEVLDIPNMIVSFVVTEHFQDGTSFTSFVTIGRVDNSKNFYYSVEHTNNDKIIGMIDFGIKEIEVSK